MIRLLGAGLIMGAAVWFAMYFAMKEKFRLKELEELERGGLYLLGQIDYLSAPLAQAMADVGWKMNGQPGLIFQKVAEGLEEQRERSAEAVWSRVWQEEGINTFLTAEDLDAVLNFGKSLGYLDRIQQENSIRLLLRYLEEALQQGRKRLEKNGRLYYGVGCLSGLLIIVTLL